MNLYDYHYVHLAPDRQIAVHTQPTWELSCVITGRGERTVGDIREPLVAGDLALIPPDIPHCWDFDPSHTDRNGRIENISISMRPEFFRKIVAAFPDMKPCIDRLLGYDDAVTFTAKQSERIIAVMARMRNERRYERAASMLALINMIAEPYDRKISCCDGRDVCDIRLSDVHIYVVCNYARAVTVDEAARCAGMNRSAFCTFFKRHTGRTFIEYLTDYRMDTAEKLLREGSMSVTEVCYACGYNNISYFSRAFRRHRGLSPSKVRRTGKD